MPPLLGPDERASNRPDVVLHGRPAVPSSSTPAAAVGGADVVPIVHRIPGSPVPKPSLVLPGRAAPAGSTAPAAVPHPAHPPDRGRRLGPGLGRERPGDPGGRGGKPPPGPPPLPTRPGRRGRGRRQLPPFLPPQRPRPPPPRPPPRHPGRPLVAMSDPSGASNGQPDARPHRGRARRSPRQRRAGLLDRRGPRIRPGHRLGPHPQTALAVSTTSSSLRH